VRLRAGEDAPRRPLRHAAPPRRPTGARARARARARPPAGAPRPQGDGARDGGRRRRHVRRVGGARGSARPDRRAARAAADARARARRASALDRARTPLGTGGGSLLARAHRQPRRVRRRAPRPRGGEPERPRSAAARLPAAVHASDGARANSVGVVTIVGAIPGATELERLVARSRLIGADPSLVLYGGGNTSTKLVETDHLGRERRVIRIKGSGSDLASCEAAHFPGLWLDELLPLRERASLPDDEMLAYLARCLVDPGAPRPSVETLLHAFLPAAHVDHVHADAICALANAPDPEAVVHEALGPDVAVVEYVRPGFALSCRVAELADSRAVVLAHHGLVTWGEAHEESYGLLVDLVSRAREYLKARGADVAVPFPPAAETASDTLSRARLRGRLSRERRQVLAVDPGQRDLAARADAAELAAERGTPDHMLRIGIRTCLLDGDVDERIAEFERWYSAYYERNAGGGTSMLSPQPRVFLVPGLGCVAAGPDAATARQRLELAAHSHRTVAAT